MADPLVPDPLAADPALFSRPDLTPCPTCQGTGTVRSDEEIGADIRQRRLTLGLSVAAVARVIGISRPYLGDLELGRRHWTARLLHGAVTALDKAEIIVEAEPA